VASSKNRQRAMARAKVERQIARRAAAARRRRQLQAGIGAGLAVVLVVVGIVWAAGGFSTKKKPKPVAECAWTPIDPASNPDLKDVGRPPETGIAHDGTRLMTITTNQGVIEAELDPAAAPCTIASFAFLAGKQFFNDTRCHRITTAGIFVLQCGDPKATSTGGGKGGPAYRFPDEYLPTPPEPETDPSASASAAPNASASPPANLYPKGTLAMANTGPDTNGSQFFIVYKDGSTLESKYTIFGKVTKGLDIVEKVAAGGLTPSDPSNPNDGTPKLEVVIQSLTVSDPAAPAPSETPAATTAATPSPTAQS
jgi:peptidyl-prolyl cis-trans isomerase B (cyclophilin B)